MLLVRCTLDSCGFLILFVVSGRRLSLLADSGCV